MAYSAVLVSLPAAAGSTLRLAASQDNTAVLVPRPAPARASSAAAAVPTPDSAARSSPARPALLLSVVLAPAHTTPHSATPAPPLSICSSSRLTPAHVPPFSAPVPHRSSPLSAL